MTDLKISLKRQLIFIFIIGFSWVSSKLPALSLYTPLYQKVQPAVAQNYETIIRNLTKETIHYALRRVSQNTGPLKKSLPPNGIDRLPCTASLDIFFEAQGKTISICLECGELYTFRYDQNDKFDLYLGSRGPFDSADLAPYFPTPMRVVDKMLELAEIDNHDVLYDLGCGDGRIVVTAAKKYGARGVGIDIDPLLINDSMEAAKAARVEGLVEFRVQDIREADLSYATVVTLYLSLESNALLRPFLEKRLNSGVTVVSHNYPIPEWKEEKRAYVTYGDGTCDTHVIYVYKR